MIQSLLFFLLIIETSFFVNVQAAVFSQDAEIWVLDPLALETKDKNVDLEKFSAPFLDEEIVVKKRGHDLQKNDYLFTQNFSSGMIELSKINDLQVQAVESIHRIYGVKLSDFFLFMWNNCLKKESSSGSEQEPNFFKQYLIDLDSKQLVPELVFQDQVCKFNWKSVESLTPGALLFSAPKNASMTGALFLVVEVAKIDLQDLERPLIGYSISLQKNQNFFIGDSGLCIHNAFPFILGGIFSFAFGGGTISFTGMQIFGSVAGLAISAAFLKKASDDAKKMVENQNKMIEEENQRKQKLATIFPLPGSGENSWNKNDFSGGQQPGAPGGGGPGGGGKKPEDDHKEISPASFCDCDSKVRAQQLERQKKLDDIQIKYYQTKIDEAKRPLSKKVSEASAVAGAVTGTTIIVSKVINALIPSKKNAAEELPITNSSHNKKND